MAWTSKEEKAMDIIGKHMDVMRLERTRSSAKFTLRSSSQEHSLSTLLSSRPQEAELEHAQVKVVKLIPKMEEPKGPLLPIQV